MTSPGIWRMRGAALAVTALCALPWLNPFSFGPVPSVPPWLCGFCAAALAVLAGAPLTRPRPCAAGPWWCLCGGAMLSLLVLWPRAAWLPPYEALALAGAFTLVALGAALARHGPAAGAVGGLPWSWWCVLLPWTVAGVASSALALVQYFGAAAPFAPWLNLAPAGEAFANLRQRNQFASLTSMALAVLFAAWVLAPRKGTRGQRAWLAGAMAMLVVGNAASASRTGLLQLFVLVACALLWRRDLRTLAWLGGVLACYAAAVLALPWLAGLDPASHGMFSRLREGDALCSSRLTLWRNVLQLIAAKPWLGWGWGELDYAHYITLYDGPRFCDILDNAHNLPLHLAVELGIPAAVLVCGSVLVWILRARPWRETDAVRRAAWLVLAVLSLALVAYAAWDYRRISQVYLPPDQRAAANRNDTLAQAQRSWLYQRQVRFAALSVADVTPDNAAFMHALATELLHFSPEPRVIEKLLDSAQLLGLQSEVAFHKPRFAAAFPQDYARWLAAQPVDPPAR